MKKWSWPSIFRIVLSLVLLRSRLGQAMSKSRLTLAHLYRPTRLRRNSPREIDPLACRRFRWMRGPTGFSAGQRNENLSRGTTKCVVISKSGVTHAEGWEGWLAPATVHNESSEEHLRVGQRGAGASHPSQPPAYGRGSI